MCPAVRLSPTPMVVLRMLDPARGGGCGPWDLAQPVRGVGAPAGDLRGCGAAHGQRTAGQFQVGEHRQLHAADPAPLSAPARDDPRAVARCTRTSRRARRTRPTGDARGTAAPGSARCGSPGRLRVRRPQRRTGPPDQRCPRRGRSPPVRDPWSIADTPPSWTTRCRRTRASTAGAGDVACGFPPPASAGPRQGDRSGRQGLPRACPRGAGHARRPAPKSAVSAPRTAL